MNLTEKRNVDRLLAAGLGYKKIAEQLCMPVNTVKSYCYRNRGTKQQTLSSDISCCEQCGKEISQTPHRKKKRFCSDKCRLEWWHSHTENLNRKAVYKKTCEQCHVIFTSYGNASRRFCCRDCYSAFRRKENNCG